MSSIKPKTGQCAECNDGIDKPLIAGRCASFHYWQYRRSLKPDKALGKPRTAIKQVSDKQAKLNALYSVAARKFKEDNPLCQVRFSVCTGQTEDVHHPYSGKDRASHFLDTTTYIAICRACHQHLHDGVSDAKARELGLKK